MRQQSNKQKSFQCNTSRLQSVFCDIVTRDNELGFKKQLKKVLPTSQFPIMILFFFLFFHSQKNLVLKSAILYFFLISKTVTTPLYKNSFHVPSNDLGQVFLLFLFLICNVTSYGPKSAISRLIRYRLLSTCI